jgi:hypothetical protein
MPESKLKSEFAFFFSGTARLISLFSGVLEACIMGRGKVSAKLVSNKVKVKTPPFPTLG